MNDVDRQLSEHGARWRAGQPEPRVDWQAVTTDRSRARGWLAVAAVAVTVPLLTGGTVAALSAWRAHRASPAATPSPSAAALAYDVPWVDRPAPAYAPPQPLPFPTPTDAPPCRADQLSPDTYGAQFTQEDGIVVAFRNTSATACLLAGRPDVVASGPGLADEQLAATSMRWPGITTNLAPGKTASTLIHDPRACQNNPGGDRVDTLYYTRLVFTMPGGGTTTVTPVHLHSYCGPSVAPYVQNPPPDRYPPQPLDGLTASLTLPRSVHAGTTLTYVVTLTNPTSQPVATTPCPGYVQSGQDGGVQLKDTHGLNCDTVTSVAPGQHVRYQMQLPIPADAPTGRLTVFWDAVSGAHAPRAKGTVQIVGNDNDRPCQPDQLLAVAPDPATTFQGHGVYSVKDAGTELTVVVTNTSHTACTLQGAPTAALTDKSGNALDLKFDNHGVGGPPPATPHVQLPPGGTARTTLAWHTRWCQPDPNPVTVHLHLPAATGSMEVRPNHGWTPPPCNGFSYGSLSSTLFAP